MIQMIRSGGRLFRSAPRERCHFLNQVADQLSLDPNLAFRNHRHDLFDKDGINIVLTIALRARLQHEDAFLFVGRFAQDDGLRGRTELVKRGNGASPAKFWEGQIKNEDSWLQVRHAPFKRSAVGDDMDGELLLDGVRPFGAYSGIRNGDDYPRTCFCWLRASH